MFHSVKTDNDGRVIGFSHHDGEIVGIEICLPGQMQLKIVGSAGDKTMVQLCNVKRFIANNFLEGNIIGTMFLWSLKNRPALVLKNMLAAMSAKSLDELITGSNDLEQFVFVLEGVYGVDIFAVVGSVNFRFLK